MKAILARAPVGPSAPQGSFWNKRSQLGPADGHAVVDLGLLVLHPLRRPSTLFRCRPRQKSGGRKKKTGSSIVGFGIVQQPLLHGKRAAGVGTVRVDRAALGRKKRAGLFRVLRHAQQDLREMAAGAQHHVHVAVQELIRRDRPGGS